MGKVIESIMEDEKIPEAILANVIDYPKAHIYYPIIKGTLRTIDELTMQTYQNADEIRETYNDHINYFLSHQTSNAPLTKSKKGSIIIIYLNPKIFQKEGFLKVKYENSRQLDLEEQRRIESLINHQLIYDSREKLYNKIQKNIILKESFDPSIRSLFNLAQIDPDFRETKLYQYAIQTWLKNLQTKPQSYLYHRILESYLPKNNENRKEFIKKY